MKTIEDLPEAVAKALRNQEATLAKLAKARKALEEIASCKSVVAGDCPDVAARTLEAMGNE